jgi:leader peptidase (prepilin peptidase)/N-methyltransferase
MLPHWFVIAFLFLLGACVGSFLNVVAWRLPRGKSIFWPPSACPQCGHRLAWYDNVPIFGWLMLLGRCRYCKAPVSPRYPLVELTTAVLFAGYYILFFVYQTGPSVLEYNIEGALMGERTFSDVLTDWPYLALYLVMISCLLAASLIDAELYIIPLAIPWLLAAVAIVIHALADLPGRPGSIIPGRFGSTLAAGGVAGLGLAILLWRLKLLPTSFPQGEPLLESEREELAAEMQRTGRPAEEIAQLPPPYTPWGVRREILKESLFLLLPLLGAIAAAVVLSKQPTLAAYWDAAMRRPWFGGLMGAVLGALVGGFCVWITRILGTLAFGRIAMGQGDTHLMLGIGAVLGAGPAVIVFFAAPFAGVLIGLYLLLSRSKHELPYGPYLALAAAVVLAFSHRVDLYLAEMYRAAEFAPIFFARLWQ